MRAIQAFYTYAKSRDLDIDEAILACHFEAILALLDGYSLWLQSGPQADNLIGRIGTAATAPFPQIDPRTRDQYLRLLKHYLSWCVTRTSRAPVRTRPSWLTLRWYLQMSLTSLNDALRAISSMFVPTALVTAA
ncbi:hypothetical protein [Pseudomonas sp. ANT_J28]|uniref:hypothetical protein n=1 Tax=Pseudomonas sp. ANT_J28 TaxID=2597352 RepID=UPI0021159308|nr:hypothetical protein [Pseudomonas sp. ANT_J28]